MIRNEVGELAAVVANQRLGHLGEGLGESGVNAKLVFSDVMQLENVVPGATRLLDALKNAGQSLELRRGGGLGDVAGDLGGLSDGV